MAVANFFWHGNSLSLYERCCIGSFVYNGFDVRVHSFNKTLNVPQGAVLCDASKLADINEVYKYIQGGKQGCLAAFSDLFRYKLLSLEPGWWFDTDVFCLKSSHDFDRLAHGSKNILVGYQSNVVINGAVLFVKTKDVAETLLREARKKGYVFNWGDIGPSLITEYINKNESSATVLSPEYFYPIPFEMVETSDCIFNINTADLCREMTKDAYCIHLWNEGIGRKKIPKELYPPHGSFLHDLFSATNEVVSPHASISITTINSLSFHAGLKRSEYKALMIYRILRRKFININKIVVGFVRNVIFNNKGK